MTFKEMPSGRGGRLFGIMEAENEKCIHRQDPEKAEMLAAEAKT